MFDREDLDVGTAARFLIWLLLVSSVSTFVAIFLGVALVST
jgi:hypothetical protein